MRARTEVLDGPADIGTRLADEILDGVGAAAADGRRFLLGCPGGRSLRSTYHALAVQAGRRDADLRGLVVVMMDEYLVPEGAAAALVPVACSAHHSCRGFAAREIVGPLVDAVGPERGPRDDATWVPSPDDPAAYDERIAAAGGVDLFLLATGAGDGHVAFNPPGTPRDARTRVVALPASTRADNLETFPAFDSLDDVPAHGVTVGVATIADLSQCVVLVALGADKRRAAARLATASGYDPDWPASIVHACRDPLILLDRAAA